MLENFCFLLLFSPFLFTAFQEFISCIYFIRDVERLYVWRIEDLIYILFCFLNSVFCSTWPWATWHIHVRCRVGDVKFANALRLFGIYWWDLFRFKTSFSCWWKCLFREKRERFWSNTFIRDHFCKSFRFYVLFFLLEYFRRASNRWLCSVWGIVL